MNKQYTLKFISHNVYYYLKQSVTISLWSKSVCTVSYSPLLKWIASIIVAFMFDPLVWPYPIVILFSSMSILLFQVSLSCLFTYSQYEKWFITILSVFSLRRKSMKLNTATPYCPLHFDQLGISRYLTRSSFLTIPLYLFTILLVKK